jgi:hypothetical protein
MRAPARLRGSRHRLVAPFACWGAVVAGIAWAAPALDHAAGVDPVPAAGRPHRALDELAVSSPRTEGAKAAVVGAGAGGGATEPATPAGSGLVRPPAGAAPVTRGAGAGSHVTVEPRGQGLAVDGGAGRLAPAVAAVNAVPGTVSTLPLRIINRRDTAQRVTMALGALGGDPGRGGGRLTHHLVAELEAGDGRRLYRGALDAFPLVPLGTLPGHGAGRWRLTVTFPDGGRPAGPLSGDNAYQGASVRARYLIRGVPR